MWAVEWGKFYALTSQKFVKIVEVETLNMALEEFCAPSELPLDALGMSSSDECLSMSILLVARYASC